MSLTYRHGADAAQGGLDITISLTPEETKEVGGAASDLADWCDTALYALGLLRSGQNLRTDGHEITPDDLYVVINDLEKLGDRIAGIKAAAIRAHQQHGGSVGDLGLAMDVPRSTAQHRRDVLRTTVPSAMEQWAATPITPQD